MPRREELPPELQPLARRNAIEVSDGRWRYDVECLIASLDGMLPAVGRPREVAPEPPARVESASWRPVLEGAAVAGVAGLLGRRLAESFFEFQDQPEEPEKNPEIIEHIWTELTRRTGTLAIVGAALALWLALRVVKAPPGRLLAKGVLIGVIAGLIGGLIWTIPVYYPDEKSKFTERATIELVSLAVSGGLVGMLIGSLWRPRRRAAAFGVAAIVGFAFAALVLVIPWKTKTPGERVWFSGLAAAAIAGATIATMLALDRSEARERGARAGPS